MPRPEEMSAGDRAWSRRCRGEELEGAAKGEETEETERRGDVTDGGGDAGVQSVDDGAESEKGTAGRMIVELGPKFIGAVERERQVVGMTFQVAAVKKALASVWRICRAGNVVQFGEGPGDCFISIRKRGGTYCWRKEEGRIFWRWSS